MRRLPGIEQQKQPQKAIYCKSYEKKMYQFYKQKNKHLLIISMVYYLIGFNID